MSVPGKHEKSGFLGIPKDAFVREGERMMQLLVL